MDWSGVDYCDVFIRLSFWRHPFTAERPLMRHFYQTLILTAPIHCRASIDETLLSDSHSDGTHSLQSIHWWDTFIGLSFWRHPFTAEHPLMRHFYRTLILTAPIHCRASIDETLLSDSHSDGTHSLQSIHWWDTFIGLSFWRHPFTAEHPLMRHFYRTLILTAPIHCRASIDETLLSDSHSDGNPFTAEHPLMRHFYRTLILTAPIHCRASIAETLLSDSHSDGTHSLQSIHCWDTFIGLSFWRHPFTAEHPLMRHFYRTLILTAPIHCRASIAETLLSDSHSDGTHSLQSIHWWDTFIGLSFWRHPFTAEHPLMRHFYRTLILTAPIHCRASIDETLLSDSHSDGTHSLQSVHWWDTFIRLSFWRQPFTAERPLMRHFYQTLILTAPIHCRASIDETLLSDSHSDGTHSLQSVHWWDTFIRLSFWRHPFTAERPLLRHFYQTLILTALIHCRASIDETLLSDSHSDGTHSLQSIHWWDTFIRLSFWRHPFTAEHPLLRNFYQTLILTAPIHCRASIDETLLSDSHSDGTHSLQSIHCWDTDAVMHFYKPDEETNSSWSWMTWVWAINLPLMHPRSSFLLLCVTQNAVFKSSCKDCIHEFIAHGHHYSVVNISAKIESLSNPQIQDLLNWMKSLFFKCTIKLKNLSHMYKTQQYWTVNEVPDACSGGA